MKKKIIEFIKFNKYIRKIYTFIGSFFIKLFGLFIKIDNNLMLFVSYGGKSFDDSPRVLYESIITDKRFKDKKIKWAFTNPNEYQLDNLDVVKIDTVKYLVTALKAKYWITNSGIERGLNFKKKDTIYINTWHGTPLKKMGFDNPKIKNKPKTKENRYDVFCVQGNYEIEIFERAFNLKKESIKKIGILRNDILTNYNMDDISSIKTKMGIKNKKIILYAPTFRNYGKEENKFNFKVNINFDYWANNIPENTVLLIRNHYEIYNDLDIEYPNIIDVSNYKKLTDLLLISDILITDYSSIMFDYAILKRPILCYAYDLERYISDRGLYLNLEDIFKRVYKNDQDMLTDILKNNINYGASKYILDNIIDEYGKATDNLKDMIINEFEKK